DRHPGYLPGFIGPVHAELAHHTVLANTGGPWRYVICDQAGMPTTTGPLRTRPAGTARTGTGTVEIQVDTRLLDELAADPDQTGVWAPIVRELLRHAATPPDDHKGGPGQAATRQGAAPVRLRPRPGVCLPGMPHPRVSHGHGPLRRLRKRRP